MQQIGFAAHPEGSSDISAANLQIAAQHKQQWAATHAVQARWLTQFCFDGVPVVAWERLVRQQGNHLPIHLGLAGLASLPTLLKYARACGIGASLNQLVRNSHSLFKLASSPHPGRVLVALARAKLHDPACLVEACHFFPFGAFEATVEWANALAGGAFTLNVDTSDVQVSL